MYGNLSIIELLVVLELTTKNKLAYSSLVFHAALLIDKKTGFETDRR